MRILITISIVLLFFNQSAYAINQIGSQTDSLAQIVKAYNDGFNAEDFERIRNSIGSQLIMINGNYSGDPENWQAHQFLKGNQIDMWIEMMLTKAKPFTNSYSIKNIDLRAQAGLVVTVEKGSNKFRSWEKEEVAYMLGKDRHNWRIVGIFIKNLKNP